MSRLEGTRFRDPASEEEFVVTNAPKTFGVSVAELDRKRVTIKYDDGETRTVPHERFRGRMTYDRVES